MYATSSVDQFFLISKITCMQNDSIINNIIVQKSQFKSVYNTLRIIKNIILLVDDRWLIKHILTMYTLYMYIHVCARRKTTRFAVDQD